MFEVFQSVFFCCLVHFWMIQTLSSCETSQLERCVSPKLRQEGIKWRFGGVPDYSLTNLKYLEGRMAEGAEWDCVWVNQVGLVMSRQKKMSGSS